MVTLTLEEALYSELSAIAGISGAVYPVNAPQGCPAPYITYDTDDQALEKSLDGFIGSGNQHCEVDVFHTTYALLKALAALVKAEIASWLGHTIGTTGPYIQNVTFDEYLPEMYESNISLYRKTIGFTVYF